MSGETLSWSKVGKAREYVLRRRAPGQEDQSSVLATTSITPPAVPGATVRYSVRANVSGSPWSNEVSIAYPPASWQLSTEASPSSVQAPALTITGTTYYVSLSGSDSNTGTSPASAWRTVGRVDQAELKPGDGVLFEGGATFTDTHLDARNLRGRRRSDRLRLLRAG